MYDEPGTSGVSRLAAGLGAVSLPALIAAGPLRSLSRVGGGDLGANAARIRAYLAAVKAAS